MGPPTHTHSLFLNVILQPIFTDFLLWNTSITTPLNLSLFYSITVFVLFPLFLLHCANNGCLVCLTLMSLSYSVLSSHPFRLLALKVRRRYITQNNANSLLHLWRNKHQESKLIRSRQIISHYARLCVQTIASDVYPVSNVSLFVGMRHNERLRCRLTARRACIRGPVRPVLMFSLPLRGFSPGVLNGGCLWTSNMPYGVCPGYKGNKAG